MPRQAGKRVGVYPLNTSVSAKFLVMKSPYAGPVTEHMFGTYWLSSVTIGLVFLAIYFVFQMKAGAVSSKFTKLMIEIAIAMIASIFLGIGIFFMCLDFDLWL